jgi:uncharacterized damage-inducible protein DinB
MTEEEYAKPTGFTYKSIRGILTHCLAGESNWMARARGEAPVFAREEDLPTLDKLKARWLDDESKVRAWLSALTDADVAASVPTSPR